MPLFIPDHFHVSPIISLDPGVDNTGIAIIMYNFKTKEIVSVETFNLRSTKLPNPDGLDVNIHSERDVKLSKLYNVLVWFFHKYRPVAVASEAPFFNSLSPMAYGSLTEVVGVIKRALIDYNPNIALALYPPLSVKKAVGAKAVKNDPEKGKQIVREAIARIARLYSVLIKPLDQMTEHEVDGTAVGYTHIQVLESS